MRFMVMLKSSRSMRMRYVWSSFAKTYAARRTFIVSIAISPTGAPTPSDSTKVPRSDRSATNFAVCGSTTCSESIARPPEPFASPSASTGCTCAALSDVDCSFCSLLDSSSFVFFPFTVETIRLTRFH